MLMKGNDRERMVSKAALLIVDRKPRLPDHMSALAL